MNVTLIVAGVVLAALCTGCDAFYYYEFQLTNLTGETIRAEIVDVPGTYSKDSVYTIMPRQTAVIYRNGGVCQPNYVPEDRYATYPDPVLPPQIKATLYIGDTVLPDSLRHHKHWDFRAKKLLGVYTLTITEELIETL
jgi:hypothetical protein